MFSHLSRGPAVWREDFHFPRGQAIFNLDSLHFCSIKNYDIISLGTVYMYFQSLKMWKISLQHYRKCRLKPETVS